MRTDGPRAPGPQGPETGATLCAGGRCPGFRAPPRPRAGSGHGPSGEPPRPGRVRCGSREAMQSPATAEIAPPALAELPARLRESVAPYASRLDLELIAKAYRFAERVHG